MVSLSDVQHAALMQALEKRDQDYDPTVKMLKVPLHGPGYHTTLKNGTLVHPTRESAEYAVALLDSGEEWRRERAIEILEVLVELQDRDPEQKTYGIWSWFQDEPLTQMSPPDWNWADFMGTQLLQVLLDHRERIPANLAKRIDEAVVHASRSIIRRNVGMDYTNIAIMGTYVTYVTAELLNVPDLLEYADTRLRRFHKFTFDNNGFPEYNSPTYTLVAITELTRMLKDIKNVEARALVTELYEKAWLDVATHYHAPTRQWSGPHSRCYSTLLRPETLAYLQRALGDRVQIWPVDQPMPASLDAHRIPARCPEQFIPFFIGITEARNQLQTFFPRVPPAKGYTYLTPVFSLGTSNYSILWNQSRPLVAYWNGPQGGCALQARFLHDGYDYSSATITVAQHDADLIAGISFATDGGDTHCNLDMLKDATIQANDLRLRLELFNIPETVALPNVTLGETCIVDLGEVSLAVQFPYAAFTGETPMIELRREGTSVYLDVIFYHGEQRAINFNEIREAACIFGLSLRAADEPLPSFDTVYTPQDDMLSAIRKVGEEILSILITRRPAPLKEIEKIADR